MTEQRQEPGPTAQVASARSPQAPWEMAPSNCEHLGVAGVAVDSSLDRVYMFTRGPGMVLVYSADGGFLARWNHRFDRPHSINVLPDGTVYCVDDAANLLRRFDPDGKEIGPSLGNGRRSATGADWSQPTTFARMATVWPDGGPPFNHPTGIAQGTNGDLYVSDGYGNCKIHRFSSTGQLFGSWGQSGLGPGQFHLPHSTTASQDGQLLVADRENDRVQVFTLAGEFVSENCNLRYPNAVSAGPDGTYSVAEGPSAPGKQTYRLGLVTEPRPARISVFDRHGKQLENLVADKTAPPNLAVCNPHDLATDANGVIYTAELPEPIRPRRIPSVIKLPPSPTIEPGSRTNH